MANWEITNKKKYIKWIVREVATSDWRKILNLSINVLQLSGIKNDQGYANIAIYQLKQPDDFWNTHFIVDNTK